MFVRIGKTALAISLATSLGLHWAFLQTVAWMGMVVSYSEHAPLKQALACTFDGKHPCCLCKAIATAKKSEKKNEFTLQVQKLEFPLLKEGVVFIPPSRFHLLSVTNSFADTLFQKPPTPPPRGFLA